MKPIYKDNIKVLYTDTDSLLYEIKTKYFYKDCTDYNILDYLDTSNYSDNKLKKCNLKSVNKMVVGKFKDEAVGDIINDFFASSSKIVFIKIK